MLGIFAKTYAAADATQLAAAIRADGFVGTQLNLSALGMPTIPPETPSLRAELRAVGDTFRKTGVAVWGVSATYNMAHPDAARRRAETAAAATYIEALTDVRPDYITLCSGSRHLRSMWHAHPDNGSAAAWYDFRAALDVLLAAAERTAIPLAIEPEPGNIICDAPTAARLLRELGNDGRALRWVFDAANLVQPHPAAMHSRILAAAHAFLGERWCCVHIKDTVAWSETLAGRGAFDFSLLTSLTPIPLNHLPWIIQDATLSDVHRIKTFLHQHLHVSESPGNR